MPVTVIKNEFHWHEIRKHHVGGSDVASLFGCGFKTHFELWAEKSGNLVDEFCENERMALGKEFERPIASYIAKKHGWTLKDPEGYYSHDTVKGMGATLDFIMQDDEKVFIVEIKWVDYFTFKREWGDEPPLKYLLQLQQGMACSGINEGMIIVYVMGSKIHEYRYQRHDGTIKTIEGAITKFWDDVKEGKEPPMASNDYDVVKGMYEDSGEEIDLRGDNQLPELCSMFMNINKQRVEAEKEEKRIKAEIIQKIGSANSALTSDFIIKYPEIHKKMKSQEERIMRYRQLTIKEAMYNE